MDEDFEGTIPPGPERLETIKRLTRDLNLASITLSDAEVRFLVDAYYIIQDDRKRSNSQVRTLDELKEPHLLLSWFAEQNRVFENQIKNALNRYSLSKPVGEWMQSICAVGPVISAGMLAHIDITQAPTVGHIWRYAGLDPTRKWEKKQKRPFNADFKVLCYKTGESFVKFQNHEKDVYGKFFVKQKDLYVRRNIRWSISSGQLTSWRRRKSTRAPRLISTTSSACCPRRIFTQWHGAGWPNCSSRTSIMRCMLITTRRSRRSRMQ